MMIAFDGNSKCLLGLVLLVLAATSGCVSACDGPIGWASVHALGVNGTTGGGNAHPVFVTNLDDLQTFAEDTEPRVIIVVGTISTERKYVNVSSNKTIKGLNKFATIHGGLRIYNESNVIIRNLNIHGIWPESSAQDVGADDGIQVRYSHHVWFDHLNMWDAPDGLIDFTLASQYMTVSWSTFWYSSLDHPHRVPMLIGGHPSFDDLNMDKLDATLHHNWFITNIYERTPRVCFGRVHIFNSYYTAKGTKYCTSVTSYGSMTVENNYFQNVADPHRFQYANYKPSFITASGNVYDNTTGKRDTGLDPVPGIRVPTAFTPSEFYEYHLDNASDVPFLVMSQAGPQ